jgi:hypothetical protein
MKTSEKESVEFRDRNNKLWRRFGDGRLEQQADRPAVTAGKTLLSWSLIAQIISIDKHTSQSVHNEQTLE